MDTLRLSPNVSSPDAAKLPGSLSLRTTSGASSRGAGERPAAARRFLEAPARAGGPILVTVRRTSKLPEVLPLAALGLEDAGCTPTGHAAAATLSANFRRSIKLLEGDGPF